jgi:hypothetical protein
MLDAEILGELGPRLLEQGLRIRSTRSAAEISSKHIHGAILQSNVEHSPAPMERFKKTLFAAVLRPARPRSRAGFRIGAGRTGTLTINTDVRIIPVVADPGSSCGGTSCLKPSAFVLPTGRPLSVEHPSASQRR